MKGAWFVFLFYLESNTVMKNKENYTVPTAYERPSNVTSDSQTQLIDL